MIDQRRWYAGVDWASQSHHVFLTDADGRRTGEKIFKHSAEGLAEMAAWLMAMTGAAEPSEISEPLALAPKRSSVQHYPDLANEQDGPSCCLQTISERATRYGAHQSCAVGRITMLPTSTSLGCSMA
jgi:hypothetical protein